MEETAIDHRLIVALDVPHALAGLEMAKRLGDRVGFYKLGLGLLTGGGLALAQELKEEHGKRIFLDLKLFDIGNTIETAARGFSAFGFDFFTVHGDPHVVRAAKEGMGAASTKILAVTILTSMDRVDLDRSCIKPGEIQEIVVQRALNALEAGADGVIASPNEIAMLRAFQEFENKLIVTPGIRPENTEKGDQKRIATPKAAISAGADHIVVGRPIIASRNPRLSAASILKDLGEAGNG